MNKLLVLPFVLTLAACNYEAPTNINIGDNLGEASKAPESVESDKAPEAIEDDYVQVVEPEIHIGSLWVEGMATVFSVENSNGLLKGVAYNIEETELTGHIVEDTLYLSIREQEYLASYDYDTNCYLGSYTVESEAEENVIITLVPFNFCLD